nr:MAG: hypothetical protein [Bacteriophage sp.]
MKVVALLANSSRKLAVAKNPFLFPTIIYKIFNFFIKLRKKWVFGQTALFQRIYVKSCGHFCKNFWPQSGFLAIKSPFFHALTTIDINFTRKNGQKFTP